MNGEGPWLETLLRRLTETPEDFLAEPNIGGKGTIVVAAVVGDLCRLVVTNASASELVRFVSVSDKGERNRLAVVLLLCWLLADRWFVAAGLHTHQVLELLSGAAEELAPVTAAARFVRDPERREEMVRCVLARLDLRPAGETVAQAEDRLTTLSSVERMRVLQAARVAEQRARAIRVALARQAAEESADKWSRE
jgi:hypothetical protein